MLVAEAGSKYILEGFIDKNNTQEISFVRKQIFDEEGLRAYLKSIGEEDKIEEYLIKTKIKHDTFNVTIHDGITNEELISVLVHRLSFLQKENYCEQNKFAIVKLKEANHWLADRIKSKRK